MKSFEGSRKTFVSAHFLSVVRLEWKCKKKMKLTRMMDTEVKVKKFRIHDSYSGKVFSSIHFTQCFRKFIILVSLFLCGVGTFFVSFDRFAGFSDGYILITIASQSTCIWHLYYKKSLNWYLFLGYYYLGDRHRYRWLQ